MASRTAFIVAAALALPVTASSRAQAAEGAAQAWAESQAALASNPDYVVVPRFGYFHKSCVHELPVGAALDKDGNVSVGGKFHHQLPACAHPVTVQAARRSTAAAQPLSGKLPTINGWVEWTGQGAGSSATTLPWFKQLLVNFTVPTAPASYVGQTVFFFPSMEPGSGNSIIQPVIQYGPSAAGGGGYWSITNWYVLANGTAVKGSLVNVNPGDKILGEVYIDSGKSCNANGSYCHYVIAYSINGGAVAGNQWIEVQPADIYNTAQVGVLEVYGVSNCNQLPASGSSVFSIQSFYQAGNPWTNWVNVTPALSGAVSGGLNPSCSYQAVPLSNGTTLGY